MTHVARARLRDFRTYESAEVELAPGINLVTGNNGSGKTNFLEAVYLGAVGRSFKSASDRELIRSGAQAAHVTLELVQGAREITVAAALVQGQKRRFALGGTQVESLLELPDRPRISVFLPDRLALIKAGPAMRRSHLDQFALALRPGAGAVRSSFQQALRQRNALLSQLGRDPSVAASGSSQLEIWDRSLAQASVALVRLRNWATEVINGGLEQRAESLGLNGKLTVSYRTQVDSELGEDEAISGFEAFLRERHASDISRGFTQSGPHRDDLLIRRDGQPISSRGSQGEQRTALLALLLTEADSIEELTGQRPILLLDDVMSELDASRREKLLMGLSDRGQTLISVTEASHVPKAETFRELRVEPGNISVGR